MDTLPGLDFPGSEIDRSAVFSEDHRHRYLLTRTWGRERGPHVLFVMLNPSYGGVTRDDRTIGRCIAYGRSWGYAGLHIVNLYSLVSPDPKVLWTVEEPTTPENDVMIRQRVTVAPLIVAAWGTNPKPDRVRWFCDLVTLVGRDLHALQLTKAGHPAHPLRLRGDLTPQPFPIPTREEP